MANRYKLSPAQVCLSWAVQRGIPVAPKSVQEDHMRQNMHLMRLVENDFDAVDRILKSRGLIRFLDPESAPGVQYF